MGPEQKSSRLNDLSVFELKVASFMCIGLNTKDISIRLHLSTHTVKSYISSIYHKLGAKNRIGAIAILLSWDVPPPKKTDLP